MLEDVLGGLLGGSGFVLAIALFIILCIYLGIRIVPQSEKHVVERFGRLRSVLGPGINFIIPFLDRVAHKVSVLERQLPNASQDAITSDNVLLVARRRFGGCCLLDFFRFGTDEKEEDDVEDVIVVRERCFFSFKQFRTFLCWREITREVRD